MNHSKLDMADLVDADIVHAFGAALGDETAEAASIEKSFSATPFGFPNPKEIPPRPWVFGYWLMRGEITAAIAPGGLGKSSFMVATALCMASGREILGKKIWGPPKRVWIINLEDSADELSRAFSAAGIYYDIGADGCGGRLFVDSGLDQPICTAVETNKDGLQIIEPVYEALLAEIKQRKIDVLIVDPFVSSHQIDENANGKIDAVVKRWKLLAERANCAICLVHHTKKMAGQQVSAESGRGAIAMINAARSTLVFNHMDKETAERIGIPENERRQYFSVTDDKPNRAPAAKGDWFKIESVSLGNPDPVYVFGDSVGVVTPWKAPDPFESVSPADLFAVQQQIAAGDYGADAQSHDWAGRIIAQQLGLNVGQPGQKDADKMHLAQVKQILKEWISKDVLTVEKVPTPKGKERPVVRVGRELNPNDFPTSKGGVGEGGGSGE